MTTRLLPILALVVVLGASCGSDDTSPANVGAEGAPEALPTQEEVLELVETEEATGFEVVTRLSGGIAFRDGLILTEAPSEEDRKAAVSAADAFDQSIRVGPGLSFASLTETQPTLELVRMTNRYRGEVDPETLEFTPTFEDQLVWMVVYTDVPWDGVGSPANFGQEAAEEDVAADERPLSDAVVVIDALTAEAVHAFTAEPAYSKP